MSTVSRRSMIALMASLPLTHGAANAADQEGIEEAGFVRIGNIAQWISVRGRDRRNPVILYLHGGPSEALSPFLNLFLPWERDFTVAVWDQRGAGRTYGRNGSSTPDMTLDRLVADAAEIAEHISAKLSHRKVVLVGQSWGSFLGVNVVKRRPELFHAFVGTGQVASIAGTIADRVQWTREQAIAAGDQATLKALDDASALPPDRRLEAEAKASGKGLVSPPDLPIQKMVLDFIGDKSNPEAVEYMAGNGFTASKLKSVTDTMDLRRLGLDMPIPMFVIQGREDHIAGFASAKEYVDDMRAPQKAFIPIDGGHYACFTSASAFVAALNERVRPLVLR